MGSYCFANKNCIVELDDNEIRCYDKINKIAVKGIFSTVFKSKKDNKILTIAKTSFELLKILSQKT